MEKIQAWDGLGMDGKLYGDWVRDLPGLLADRDLLSRFIQRIFPSLLVRSGLMGLGIPLDNPHIIAGFAVMNGVLLLAGLWIFLRLADQLQWRSDVRWLGFVLLFGNFFILKWMSFYPVLTDMVGFVSGLVMFYLYYHRHFWAWFLFLPVVFFSWPSAFFMALILFMAPRQEREIVTTKNIPLGLDKIGALLGVALIVICSWVWVHEMILPVPALTGWFWLSFLIMMGFLYFGARPLLANAYYYRFSYPFELLARYWKYGVVAVAMMWGLNVITLALSDPAIDGSSWWVIKLMLALGVAMPGNFLVAHFWCFGFGVFLMMMFWKSMAQEMQKMGPAPVVVAGLGLVLSLGSESRHMVHYFTFLLPVLLMVVQQNVTKIKPEYLWILGGAALLVSRVWLTILPAPYERDHLLLSEQKLYANLGSFIRPDVFVGSAVVAVILCVGMYYFIRPSLRRR